MTNRSFSQLVAVGIDIRICNLTSSFLTYYVLVVFTLLTCYVPFIYFFPISSYLPIIIEKGVMGMCLVNFHFQEHPNYKLIVAANRDEFYERPTAVADFWKDSPNILAGRDLVHMGTWLGVTRSGRFAALTNYRDPNGATGRYSRGDIVRDFLANEVAPIDFLKMLAENKEDYAGYNVIIGDANQLFHYNNILDEMNTITPGTHSLSNHTLNTPWPKVSSGKRRLGEYIRSCPDIVALDPLFEIISDQTVAKDVELPETGVGLEMERLLSPMFITMPNYGTRSSTVLLIDKGDRVTFVERTFHDGEFQLENRFMFKIGDYFVY